MPDWKSIAEMVRELELQAASNDLEGVKSELRREIAALHPDRNDGQFLSAAAEARFRLLTDGLTFLDGHPGTAIIPVGDLKAIVAAVRQALEPTPHNSVTDARSEYRNATLAESKSRYILPRFGSIAFAAACGGLLAFSSSLKDNPVLGPLCADRLERMLLIYAFNGSGLLFLVTWWMEQRDNAQAEWLATEDGMRHTLSRVVNDVQRKTASPLQFSFGDYCQTLYPRHHDLWHVFFPSRTVSGRNTEFLYAFDLHFLWPRRLWQYLRQASLSLSSAERLAKLQLDELERRGVVTKNVESRLDIVYTIDAKTIDELGNGD